MEISFRYYRNDWNETWPRKNYSTQRCRNGIADIYISNQIYVLIIRNRIAQYENMEIIEIMECQNEKLNPNGIPHSMPSMELSEAERKELLIYFLFWTAMFVYRNAFTHNKPSAGLTFVFALSSPQHRRFHDISLPSIFRSIAFYTLPTTYTLFSPSLTPNSLYSLIFLEIHSLSHSFKSMRLTHSMAFLTQNIYFVLWKVRIKKKRTE